MKKGWYLLIGLIAGATGMHFCMTNEKAQNFFKKAKEKGEEVLEKGKEKVNSKMKEAKKESEEEKK